MDPYVTVNIGAQKQRTRTHNSAGKNPVWNESLNFKIHGERMAEFNVYDKDTFGKDDWIGQVSVPLDQVTSRGTFSNWYNLTRKGKNSGTLMIQFEWHGDHGAQGGMGMGMQQPFQTIQPGMMPMHHGPAYNPAQPPIPFHAPPPMHGGYQPMGPAPIPHGQPMGHGYPQMGGPPPTMAPGGYPPMGGPPPPMGHGYPQMGGPPPTMAPGGYPPMGGPPPTMGPGGYPPMGGPPPNMYGGRGW